MKVTYKDIPGLVRCPFQKSKNCYPGCDCTSESTCWKEFTKEVHASELKRMIDEGAWIVKVEPNNPCETCPHNQEYMNGGECYCLKLEE